MSEIMTGGEIVSTDPNSVSTCSPAGSIQAIDKGDVHRICSGQVVLNLATAVKELVENSLDAGSTHIEIRLKDYGSELVEVQDNGSGVEEANMAGLTLKHHTSKIRDFSDVVGVSTFGFRGEALSSLCALSNLMVVTCHKDTSVATKLLYDRNGKITSKTPCARQQGTTVSIGQLFHTLPVRHKEFQRNLKKEYAKMIQVLNAYCLIATNVKITCTNQLSKGKKSLVVSTNGNNSVKENLTNIFGVKQVQSVIKFEQACPVESVCEDYNLKVMDYNAEDFKIVGYVSSSEHGQGRSSADRQYFFINSRPCDPPKVSRLVNEVYHMYNRHQYPFVMLNITLERESVDVNVTPDKRQVFMHQEKLLLATLKTSLMKMFEPLSSTYQINAPRPMGTGLITATFAPLNPTPTSGNKTPESICPSETTATSQHQKPTFASKMKRAFSSAFSGELKQEASKVRKVSSSEEVACSELTSSPSALSSHMASSSPSHPTSDSPVASGGRVNSPSFSQSDILLLHTPSSSQETDSCAPLSSSQESPSVLATAEHSTPEHSDCLSTKLCVGDRNILSPTVPAESSHYDHTRGITEKNNLDKSVDETLGSPISVSKSQRNSYISTVENRISSLLARRSSVKNSPECSKKGNSGDRLNVLLARRGSWKHEMSKQDSTNNESGEGLLTVTGTSDSDGKLCSSDVSNRTMDAPSTQLLSQTVSESEEPAAAETSYDSATEVERNVLTVPFSMATLREKLQKKKVKEEDSQNIMGRGFHARIKPGDNKTAEEELQRKISKDMFAKMEILGQFNLGFIIARLDQDLFIIDQHATDEKYNFEDLQKNTVIKSQKLIQPQDLELTVVNEGILMDNIEIFRKNGFDFVIDEDAPPTKRVRLSAMPVSQNWTFGKSDVDELIFMLQDSPGVLCRPSRVRAMFASRSCRKAIMIGTALNKAEMTKLVRHMGEIEQPWNCPHGRPTMRHLLNLTALAD